MISFQAVWECDCKCGCENIDTSTMWYYVDTYESCVLEPDKVEGWTNCGSYTEDPDKALCPKCQDYPVHGLL